MHERLLHHGAPCFCLPRCSFAGCYPNTETGFQSTVACGATASTTTCGTCAAVSGAAAVTYTAGVQQMCH